MWLLAVIALACCAGLWPATTAAHAELVRTEPPINGLIIAAPSELHLFFSEDVATSDPAPSIRVLDENGNEQPVTVTPNGRELIVATPSLSPGTWTVAWAVKSSTDGHLLSGTYAFRIGGGIPAGAATVSGQTPAIWAVLARWLTFLGAAIAAAGFLFGMVIEGENRTSAPVSQPRLIAIILGALIALAATIAEPFGLVLFPSGDESVNLSGALRSLPDAWWIRPPALALAFICGIASLYAMRRRLPAWLALTGGALSLGSLLGLSLTSHAAGRETWREFAVASDILHQWSVALWVGGLAQMAIWWPKRQTDDVPVPLRRFSAIALILFAIGVVTGVVNAGFVFPALDTLWNSDYGYILIAKLAVLLIPFALAIYHRRAIAIARKSSAAVRSIFRLTLRIEVIAAAAVLIGGATLALSAPPIEKEPGPDHVTLMEFATTDSGETTGMVHLRVAPVKPGANDIEVWLTDIYGKQVPNDPPARLAVDFVSLNHGTTNADASLEPIDLAASRYSASGLDLSLDGWWQITAKFERDGQATSSANFYLLLPDPNIHGFDAPPAPDNDQAAQAVLDRGIATMEAMDRFRWSESINTGADTMVVANLAQIRATDQDPMSYEQILSYSGSFTPRFDGSAPPPPTIDSYHSVTIGDRSWLVQADGTWLEQPPNRYGPISEWGSIYHLANHVEPGGTSEIAGEPVQIITFHTPAEPGQSEAWFAWWVGAETGRVYQLTMVAASHYMVWHYTDFNGDWQIGPPPPDLDATPAASPAG
jgi:copper transport protein